MKNNGAFLGQSLGPVQPGFGARLGAQGWISIPYPTMVFWVRNRHIAPYSDVPFIPAEEVKTTEVPAFGMAGRAR